MKALILTDMHRGYSERTFKLHQKLAKEVSRLEWHLLIVCGDSASNRKEHFKSFLRYARELAGDRPVLLVRGNHDLWDRSQRSLVSLMDVLHKEWFRKFGVLHLEDGPFHAGGITFVGWDGWYCQRPDTNDMSNINRYVEGDTWSWLQKRSWQYFERAVLDAQKWKTFGNRVIAVTHFPIVHLPTYESLEWSKESLYASYTSKPILSGNFSYFDHIKPFIDVLCYGHTHKAFDEVLDGVLVINAGGDYDKPRYKIIDLS